MTTQLLLTDVGGEHLRDDLPLHGLEVLAASGIIEECYQCPTDEAHLSAYGPHRMWHILDPHNWACVDSVLHEWRPSLYPAAEEPAEEYQRCPECLSDPGDALPFESTKDEPTTPQAEVALA